MTKLLYSNATATIHFITRSCVALIRERRLLVIGRLHGTAKQEESGPFMDINNEYLICIQSTSGGGLNPDYIQCYGLNLN